MREINPKGANTQNQTVLILQDNPRQQQLVKVNRYLLYLVAALMTLVMVMGFLLTPAEKPLAELKNPAPPLQYENPALSSEINILKGQVTGLVSGSIESKLRILEDSIRAGSVNNALGTIQDLKRDVRVLQSYSESAKLNAPPKNSNDTVLQEVSHLKNLVYLTLASVSLMFAALAAIWANRRYRLNHQRRAYLPKENKQ